MTKPGYEVQEPGREARRVCIHIYHPRAPPLQVALCGQGRRFEISTGNLLRGNTVDRGDIF